MIEGFLEKLKSKSQNLYSHKPITVAFLGDSITQGCFETEFVTENKTETVFESRNSYLEKLKIIFNMLYPKAVINTINAGVGGDNAESGLKRLENDVLSFNPDLIVVCFGLNDCLSGAENAESYNKFLKQIFFKIKQKDIPCILMTPNTMNFKESKKIKNEVHSKYAKNFAEIQNSGVLDQYVKKAKEAAEEENIAVCDCYDKWKKMNGNGVDTTELLSNSLNHPIRDIHWLFAFYLADTILF